MSVRGRTAAVVTSLLLPLLWASTTHAAEAPTAVPAPTAVTAPTAPTASADATTPADTQAAAAQHAAQEAEAQVIELRRQIDALERQHQSYDDVRRRLDEIDARQGEIDRHAQAAADANPPETSVIRFHDDGFSIRSPDNGFYLHPLLRVQAIYTGEIASKGFADKAAPDTSGFSLGRAEMILEGHVGGPFFQYRLQLDAAESPSLKDAYVTWQPNRMLALEAGQFKVPYGLQRQYWKAELEFIDISVPMAAFSLERDLGLMAVARLLPGRLTVQAALLNGAGANVPNDNFDLAYALRIVATPFGPLPATEGDIEGHARPLLSIGAAGYFNLVPTDIVARSSGTLTDTDEDGNGRIDNVAIWQGGSSCGRSGAGRRCRASSSAGARTRAPGRRCPPFATTGAGTSRGATSSCRAGSRSRRASATPTCRSTAPPARRGRWRVAGRTSRAAWWPPTCAATESRRRPSTATSPPTGPPPPPPTGCRRRSR